MGKTRNPRCYYVHPSLQNTLEVCDLREAGHTIELIPYDEAIYLGPNCAFMTAAEIKYLPITLKEMAKRGKVVRDDST